MIILNFLSREGATSPVMRLSEPYSEHVAKDPDTAITYLERDGIVQRTIHPQVPPKVEYKLTSIGVALPPTLRALLDWVDLRKQHSLD